MYRYRPVIEAHDVEGGLFGSSEFTMLVRNEGDAGEVLIEVEFYDEDNDLLGSETETTSLDEGSSRLSFDVDVPSNTDYYEFEIEER